MPVDRQDIFSVRTRLQQGGSPWLVIAVPLLLTMVIAAVAWRYDIPARAPAQDCTVSAPAVVTGKRLADDTVQLRVGAQNATGIADRQPPHTAGECSTVLMPDHAAGPALARARALTVISFTTASIIALAMAAYAVMSVGYFAAGLGARSIGGTLLAAAAVATGVVQLDLLPHPATLDLFELLDQVPGFRAGARGIAICGSWLVVFTAALYVAAVYMVASMPAADEDARKLARRFDRLTTLSTLSSLAFAVAMLTLVLLLSWPLSIDRVGTGFAETATTIDALFGLHLTAILAGAYLPAAAVLSARADALLPDAQYADGGDPQGWLSKRGLTVVTGPRLAASLATLLPLIAGSVTSGASATGALGALLR